MMDITEIQETIAKADRLKTQLAEMIGAEPTQDAAQTSSPSPWTIGGNYFIRTVTHIVTGRVVAVTATEIVVVDAAWIASTGRYMQAIASARFDEVEPYPAGQEVIVGRGAVIDSTKIPSLPTDQE